MKKLITALLTLSLVFTLAMAAALAEEPAPRTFRNEITFGMNMAQVREKETLPVHEIENRDLRGPFEFSKLEYEDVSEDGMIADISYLFVNDSLVAIHYDFADRTGYDNVKAKLTAVYGNAVNFDAAALGAGRYVVDDDGDLDDCREMITADSLTIVLERDRDGDVDATFVDMTAPFLKP